MQFLFMEKNKDSYSTSYTPLNICLHQKLIVLLFFIFLVYLKLWFPLLWELSEELYDDPGIGTVVHIDGWTAHPCLEVVDRQWDVLGIAL